MAVEQSGDNLPKGGCNREVNWDKGGVKPWMDTLDTVGSAGTEGIGGFFPSELLVLVPVHCNWKKKNNKERAKGKVQISSCMWWEPREAEESALVPHHPKPSLAPGCWVALGDLPGEGSKRLPSPHPVEITPLLWLILTIGQVWAPWEGT